VILEEDLKPVQVFSRPYRAKITPCDWTAWVKPDFVARSKPPDQVWHEFVTGTESERAFALPERCAMMRFRVTRSETYDIH
jgi:hypothetical protein